MFPNAGRRSSLVAFRWLVDQKNFGSDEGSKHGKIKKVRMSISTFGINVAMGQKLAAFAPILAFDAANIIQKFLPIVIIIMAVVFILGIIAIVSGATRIKNGDTDGVMGIVAGVIMAAAPIIMGAIYVAFGMSQASITFGQ